ILPILACAYATIGEPLLGHLTTGDIIAPQNVVVGRIENRIFWPALATISVVFAMRNRSRITLPPHIICLFAYLSFAGPSVLWAFRPELSFIRFVQQVMIVTSIVLPAMAADRTSDIMRGMFLCFALGLILNIFFVIGRPPIMTDNKTIFGYQGYFADKNTFG